MSESKTCGYLSVQVYLVLSTISKHYVTGRLAAGTNYIVYTRYTLSLRVRLSQYVSMTKPVSKRVRHD